MGGPVFSAGRRLPARSVAPGYRDAAGALRRCVGKRRVPHPARVLVLMVPVLMAQVLMVQVLMVQVLMVQVLMVQVWMVQGELG